MTMAVTAIKIRMYDVGFGDAFLITLVQGAKSWRMLVDCGVHSLGKARPLIDVVRAIIAELTAASSPGSPPALDVVVATHHHADHIAGFAYPDWEAVQVGEVWVPFVEDPSDPDAVALKSGLDRSATALNALVGRAATAAGRGAAPLKALAMAGALAVNSLGNTAATDRLLGRNGKHFRNNPTVRYLPNKSAALNVLPTSLHSVLIHVLGPSRDPNDLKRMDPPSSDRWQARQRAFEAQAADAATPADGPAPPEDIFDDMYQVSPVEAGEYIGAEIVAALDSLDLDKLMDDSDEFLAAASILERSVNNTSVFFVLDVAGTHLVFVGDSQQGAWDHVLSDPAARPLVSNPAFYKIGHHGSHNATPRDYVASCLGRQGAYTMLPYGNVRQWGDIPNAALLGALANNNTVLVRADEPKASGTVEVGPDGLWSEITIQVDGG